MFFFYVWKLNTFICLTTLKLNASWNKSQISICCSMFYWFKTSWIFTQWIILWFLDKNPKCLFLLFISRLLKENLFGPIFSLNNLNPCHLHRPTWKEKPLFKHFIFNLRDKTRLFGISLFVVCMQGMKRAFTCNMFAYICCGNGKKYN